MTVGSGVKVLWSDEQTATLRRRWDQGASASVIAAEIGMTRNAVLGRVWRLGLSRRRDAYAPKKKRVPSPRKPAAPRPPKLRVVHSIFDFIGPMRPADWYPNPIGIVSLLSTHCRWPVGEPKQMQFCGESKLGGHVYCARHCRMAYRPNNRKAA